MMVVSSMNGGGHALAVAFSFAKKNMKRARLKSANTLKPSIYMSLL